MKKTHTVLLIIYPRPGTGQLVALAHTKRLWWAKIVCWWYGPRAYIARGYVETGPESIEP